MTRRKPFTMSFLKFYFIIHPAFTGQKNKNETIFEINTMIIVLIN